MAINIELRELNRRQFLRISLLAAGSGLLAACGARPTPTPRPTEAPKPADSPTATAADSKLGTEGYALTQIIVEGKPWLVDQRLEALGGEIGRLRFTYDNTYRPNDAKNGAIGLEVVRIADGPVRMMSEELRPKPRFMFNDDCPYLVKGAERLYKWPVFDLGKDDLQRIFVGLNNNTYGSMRVYEIQRDPSNAELLIGSFVGIRNIDPSQIHPEQTPKTCPANFPTGII